MTKAKKTFLLIDGNALIHRAYHALPPLSTKKGELVNAVYGFASTLMSVLEKFKPEYIAASFDLAAPTFRHEAFAEYKAKRKKAPDDLYAQIPRVKELVRAFNIPIYECEGFEADDVIGTLTRQVTETEDREVIIITGDADALQLVNEKVKVFSMRRGMSDTVLYDEQAVSEKYGFSAYHIVDFKGLRGDASDNIPGVNGIGEKTAADLIRSFGSLENIYNRIEEVKPAVREKLIRDKAQAILSKQLGTIDTHVPISVRLEECVARDFSVEKVESLFRDLNFFSLLKRIPGRLELKVTNEKLKGVREKKYVSVTAENIQRFMQELKQTGIAAFSLDTDLDGKSVLGVAISFKNGRAWYLAWKEYEQYISEIFADSSLTLIGYDVKQTWKTFHQLGKPFQAKYSDVLLSAYVLNSGSNLDFDRLVVEEIGDELSYQAVEKQTVLFDSPKHTLYPVCERAEYIFKLHATYEDKIFAVSKTQTAHHTLDSVLKNMELPLIPLLADMEVHGILFQKEVFYGIAETVNKKIMTLEISIHELAGEVFNINSPKQLADVLFVKLGLSTALVKKNKTGFSTASNELEKLREEHEIIGKIEEYRELFKLKTTYLDVLPGLSDDQGRIHTTFNQAVAATGRLSSTDPNLQNIPVRTDIGMLMRTAFIAPEGKRLISADYSQIDLRCAAHVSQDRKLMEAFCRGDDIHTATASEVFHVSPSQVTSTMRRKAKTLNFGVLYGMSSFGFSRAAGVDRQEAQKFINDYMNTFPGIAEYMKRTKEATKKFGYVETLFGRRRYVPEINSPNFQVVQASERIAINMPIQGLASDIMKLAMIASDSLIRSYGKDAALILQVHDELIFEVDEDREIEFMKHIKSIMENVYSLSVPLVVDVKAGNSWGEL